MSHKDTLSLGERLEVEAALDVAFAPLRSRQTDLSARRVRAAVRWGRGAPPAPSALAWSGAVARLSELSVAVGMFLVIFSAGVGPAVLPPETTSAPSVQQIDEGIYPVPRVSAALEDERYIRWLRIDRYVPLQDWLDPSTVRAGLTKRLEPPAPRDGAVISRDPY
jgi:hypothetical protein